jgi:transcriptional regulator with XRE-family HTH domain
MSVSTRKHESDPVAVMELTDSIVAAIGRVLKARRLKAKMKQTDLARAVGVHPVMECQREAGDRACSVTDLFRYATAFGCHPLDLFEAVVKETRRRRK